MSALDSLSLQTSGFVAHWNQRTEDFPVLKLDYSWPSIGTIGLLAGILAGKAEKTREEETFIDVLAWYLGSVIQSRWEVAGIRSDLTYTKDGVEIAVASDKQLNAKLTLIVTVLLKDLPFPLPVLTGYQREFPITSDIFTPVMLGLIIGDSSLMEGVDESDENILKSKSEDILKSLSRSTAQYYENCFPDEPLGQMAELYLAGQIYPPLGMNEAWPALSAVTELLNFTNALKASKTMLLSFAENALTVPNEQLAHTGMALYAALNEKPTQKAIAHYESRRTLLGFLRPAMVKAQSLMTGASDWLISETLNPTEQQRYSLEAKLGFLPWIVMSNSVLAYRVKEPKINKLIKSLVNFDFAGAEGVADSLIELDPGNVDIRLQRTNLHLIAGELQQAELTLRMLASEPEAEEDARLYALWTKLDLRINSIEDAKRHFEMAMRFSSGDKELSLKIFNEVASDFILAGEEAVVAPYFERLRSADFLFLLNKFRALNLSEDTAERATILKKIAQLCPINTEIFYNFFLK
jgi:hypothetical protein